jgi:hypothetical protein
MFAIDAPRCRNPPCGLVQHTRRCRQFAERLVEVMPNWRFRTLDLSLVHLGNRHMPKALRLFKVFAVQMAPARYLPT